MIKESKIIPVYPSRYDGFVEGSPRTALVSPHLGINIGDTSKAKEYRESCRQNCKACPSGDLTREVVATMEGNVKLYLCTPGEGKRACLD